MPLLPGERVLAEKAEGARQLAGCRRWRELGCRERPRRVALEPRGWLEGRQRVQLAEPAGHGVESEPRRPSRAPEGEHQRRSDIAVSTVRRFWRRSRGSRAQNCYCPR